MVLINFSVAEVSPGFAAGYPIPIGSMVLLYMITFTINIPQMLAYITYMDPMGYMIYAMNLNLFHIVPRKRTLTMASLKNSGPLQKFARCYHRPKAR